MQSTSENDFDYFASALMFNFLETGVWAFVVGSLSWPVTSELPDIQEQFGSDLAGNDHAAGPLAFIPEFSASGGEQTYG